MSGMNFVDITILVILFVSAVIGFSRGFISEVVSLLTLIAAIMVAIYFSEPLATYFTASSSVQGVVSSSSSAIGVNTATPVSYVALGISFALLFAGTLIAGAIVKLLLNLIFKTGVLGIGNSLLGGVFGIVRGGFIVLVIIFLVQLSPLSSESWFQQSQLVARFQPGVTWLASNVSPTLAGLQSKFGQTVQDLGSSVRSATNRFQ